MSMRLQAEIREAEESRRRQTVKPLREQFCSGRATLCVHELKGKFLQGISLIKPLGEMEYHTVALSSSESKARLAIRAFGSV